MTAITAKLPTGTWTVDPAQSSISFTVRSFGIAKAHGSFDEFTAVIVTENGTASVNAQINVASINTNNAKRDTHLRSADFFDIEKFPVATYRSTSVRPDGNGYLVDGELTVHGVTQPVTLALEFEGVVNGPHGGLTAGFKAGTTINRTDFGVKYGPGIIGKKVSLSLAIKATQS